MPDEPTKATATPAAVKPSATSTSTSAGAASTTPDPEIGKKFEEEKKLRRAAEKELQQARAAIEQHQRAQNTEVENMKGDFEKLEQKAEEFENFKYTTYLELAILRDSRYRWQEGASEDVVAAIDLDAVTISDDGKIDGLDDELKRIADKKKYLLAPATGAAGPPQVLGQGISGVQPSGSPGGNADFDEKALMKKYKIA